jgi:hypothetical protein
VRADDLKGLGADGPGGAEQDDVTTGAHRTILPDRTERRRNQPDAPDPTDDPSIDRPIRRRFPWPEVRSSD